MVGEQGRGVVRHIFEVGSCLGGFTYLRFMIFLYFPDKAHDKLEEGRQQVETQDSVQLSKEVRFHE